MESKHTCTHAHCNLTLSPTPSSNPYTCTDTLLHLFNSTSDSLKTMTVPARAAAAPPLQVQVFLYPNFSQAQKPQTDPDWTIWVQGMGVVGGGATDWVGKQTSGCPAQCPGRTQQEAAHSLTADPSQTQHDLQLQLPGWQGLDTTAQGLIVKH